MGTLRDHEADLDRLLARLHRRSSFVDIMAQSSRGQQIALDRQRRHPATEPRFQGAAVRAWDGTRWVESATSDFSPAGLALVAESLERTLSAEALRTEPPGRAATTVASTSTDPARPLSAVGMDEMIRMATEIRDWALQVPSIKETQVRIGWQDEERWYVNTAGARCYQNVSRVHAGASPIAMESGNLQFDFLSSGGVGGVEQLASMTEANVKATADAARALLHAVFQHFMDLQRGFLMFLNAREHGIELVVQVPNFVISGFLRAQ